MRLDRNAFYARLRNMIWGVTGASLSGRWCDLAPHVTGFLVCILHQSGLKGQEEWVWLGGSDETVTRVTLLCAGFTRVAYDTLPEWENLHGEGKKGQLSEGGLLSWSGCVCQLGRQNQGLD